MRIRQLTGRFPPGTAGLVKDGLRGTARMLRRAAATAPRLRLRLPGGGPARSRALRVRARPERVPDPTAGPGSRQQRLVARSRRVEPVAAAGTVLLGVLLTATAPAPVTGPSPAETAAESPGPAPAGARDSRTTAEEYGASPAPLSRSAPVRVRIPWLGTDVAVFGAGLTPEGGPPVPPEDDAMRAAWYTGGAAPGERGAALLGGHLDTAEGPAAFAGLGTLEPGRSIEVDREDGATAVFTVQHLAQHPEADFPDEQVHGTAGEPELRLITSSGQWHGPGGHAASIVVHATLSETRPVS
ncbi:sortase [Streptomyces sp. ACA25]|uniref:sortase domain-containing protein n=1 Tax=Streptomyces sp. ACA25 TaxID=3022596 RepID=UPI0023075B36|nr:sortase [Streptomyces sp. ACA25]MDB1086029.1 sortase [Streptomyces sp. ACA25]